nr:hypothetical protein [Tanacetum cinerariifolium]
MKTILWTIAALFENQWSNEVDVPIAKPIVAEPNPIAAKPNHNSVKETSFSGDVVEGVTLVSRVYNDDSSKSTGAKYAKDALQLYARAWHVDVCLGCLSTTKIS